MAGAAMGLTAEAIQGRVDSTVGLFAATVAASAVGELLELAFATVTSRIRGNAKGIPRDHGPLMVTAVCVYAPVVAALASPTTRSLRGLPFCSSHRRSLPSSYSAFTKRRPGSTRNSSLYTTISKLQTLDSAKPTCRSRQPSCRRSKRATDTQPATRERLRPTRKTSRKSWVFPTDDVERTYLSGLVHDIGKIGLPATLLNKEGRLTLEEFREMERHSEIGERILSKVEAYADVSVIVRHHHERMDGEGYPDKIRGEDIPLISRIIGVADAYNAMTSDRPYRAAMGYSLPETGSSRRWAVSSTPTQSWRSFRSSPPHRQTTEQPEGQASAWLWRRPLTLPC